jgi:hypothetical protein
VHVTIIVIIFISGGLGGGTFQDREGDLTSFNQLNTSDTEAGTSRTLPDVTPAERLWSQPTSAPCLLSLARSVASPPESNPNSLSP